jgi:hypothetical protein
MNVIRNKINHNKKTLKNIIEAWVMGHRKIWGSAIVTKCYKQSENTNPSNSLL